MLRRGARPAAWCKHNHPKEVRVLGRECSVRCLGCGQAGPMRASIVAAREALRCDGQQVSSGQPEEALTASSGARMASNER
jgi:hypothetical protein